MKPQTCSRTAMGNFTVGVLRDSLDLRCSPSYIAAGGGFL